MKKHTKKIGAFLLKKRQIATKILTKVLRFPFVFNSYFLPKNKPEVGKLEPLINCRNIGPKCGSFLLLFNTLFQNVKSKLLHYKKLHFDTILNRFSNS